VSKFNSLNKECLALRFEEGFGRLMRLKSPSEANMLAVGDVDLTAQI
jgi:hypothetical protein